MTIKNIFDEISIESSTNKKMEILSKYKENQLLKDVLYYANSKRIKFYIKQIPEYTTAILTYELSKALKALELLSSRQLTGGAASTHLQSVLSLSSPEDAYIIERIIEKDCKIGMGTSNINKVFPKLIEDTPYMGAKSYDEKLAKKIFEKGEKGYSNIKMDGRYCNAIIRDGDVELESRQGEPTIVTGAKFLQELSTLNDCVLNGELTMTGVSRYESNGIIASIIDICSKKGIRTEAETEKKLAAFNKEHGDFILALNSIVFTIWDMISIDEYFNAKSDVPYNKRFDAVVEAITLPYNNGNPYTNINFVEAVLVETYEEAMQHFQSALARGEEGTILKAYKGTWKDGKPNHCIKFKKEINLDLKIVGFNYGTGKNKDVISSIDVVSAEGLLKTSPTGISESMMKFVTENQDKLLNTILEVKCSGISQDSNGNYSVLHPVFKLLRDDKKEANTLAECVQIDKAAMGL